MIAMDLLKFPFKNILVMLLVHPCQEMYAMTLTSHNHHRKATGRCTDIFTYIDQNFTGSKICVGKDLWCSVCYTTTIT